MKKMADEIKYGAGGVPYVGPGGTPAPAPAPVVEETPVEPKITVEVTDFDTGDMELKVLEDEISVDKSFWDDCYFYFLLSLFPKYHLQPCSKTIFLAF